MVKSSLLTIHLEGYDVQGAVREGKSKLTDRKEPCEPQWALVSPVTEQRQVVAERNASGLSHGLPHLMPLHVKHVGRLKGPLD